MESALFGFAGVLLGGLVSFGTQWHFQRRQEKLHDKSRMRQFQFVLWEAVNDVLKINRHIDDTIPTNHTGAIWGIFQPISNFHSEVIELDKSLLSLFCDGKSDDFLNQTLDFFSFRNSLVTLIQQYNIDRTEINVITAPFADVRPGVNEGQIALIAEENPIIVIKINALEQLAQQLVATVVNSVPLAEQISDAFPAAAKDICGDNFKVKFETTEDEN